MEDVVRYIKPFGRFLYLVYPNETSFEKLHEVPDYTSEAIPAFIILVIIEQLVLWLQGKSVFRISDGISSMSSGTFMEITKIMVLALEVTLYTWTFERYHIMELPWNSAWTWWIAFIGSDFCYYWIHRMSHEVNIMWAAHQVHHSSEDYNLTTALRQSIFQQYFAASFYLPMALFVPPSVFLVHLQLNTLFQFYIHTCAIGKMGFLDYIINTPSNHRVHHGRNRYCIDKNYAGVLMIWDIMFGTYVPEGDDIAYGLVHPLNSFEPLYVQFCHFIYIWKTFWAMEGIGNKLSVLFKGPGWTPGSSRLGNIEDIPDISAPQPKYDPKHSMWCNIYLLGHFVTLILLYQQFAVNHHTFNFMVSSMFTGFVLLSLVSFGAILDHLSFAPLVEVARCAFMVALRHRFITPVLTSLALPVYIHQGLAFMFLVSCAFWVIQCALVIKPVLSLIHI